MRMCRSWCFGKCFLVALRFVRWAAHKCKCLSQLGGFATLGIPNLGVRQGASCRCLCRQLSYEGAEFQLRMISLLPTFQVQYARAAALWQLLDMIIYKEGVFAKVKNRLSTTFWGDHQRFFKSMLVAAKVPAVATETRDAIASGYSVVIGLQSTGAANLEAEKESKRGVEGPF